MNNDNQFPVAAGSSDALQVYGPDNASFADEDEIDLRALWRIVVRYRQLIAIIFTVVVFTALLISLLLRPMYEATVSIELNTSGRNIVKFQNVENQDLTSREYIQTQSKILSSSAVAKKAIDELDLTSQPEFNGQFSQRGLLNGLKSIMGMRKPILL